MTMKGGCPALSSKLPEIGSHNFHCSTGVQILLPGYFKKIAATYSFFSGPIFCDYKKWVMTIIPITFLYVPERVPKLGQSPMAYLKGKNCFNTKTSRDDFKSWGRYGYRARKS